MATVLQESEHAIQVPILAIYSTVGNPATGIVLTSFRLRSMPGTKESRGCELLTQNCGADCFFSSNNGNYYARSATPCSGTNVQQRHRVTNQVALLPPENNDELVQLPAVPLGGLASAHGSLNLA